MYKFFLTSAEYAAMRRYCDANEIPICGAMIGDYVSCIVTCTKETAAELLRFIYC